MKSVIINRSKKMSDNAFLPSVNLQFARKRDDPRQFISRISIVHIQIDLKIYTYRIA